MIKKFIYRYVDLEDPEILVLEGSEIKESDRDDGDEAIGSIS